MKSNKKNKFPKQFPRIYRVITDKDLLIIFLGAFIILIAIAIVGIDLHRNLKLSESQENYKLSLENEENGWEQILNKYPDYRDGYLKLAIVKYKLGKSQEAEWEVEKSLKIDPNFKEAKTFQSFLLN